MSFEIKKIYTDNPFVDEMVYYSRLMGIDTTLKMKAVADRNETVESLRRSGLYISCIEGTAKLNAFDKLTVSALNEAGIIDPGMVELCIDNKAQVPKDKIDAVTKAMRKEYIENYVELNNYYRMLHGEPAIGQEDYVTSWVPPDGVIIDLSKPVHMMSNSEVSILDRYGILDQMISEDPNNRLYMRHLGRKKIDYYFARRAGRFDPLYVPTVESDAIEHMFKEKLNDNKWYVLRAVYSEAYNYQSDYYDNFIAVFIIIITIVDIISRIQEFIARKEIFDIRSVQWIFKSYGVPFYEEIPLKYQIAMVKNLHTLLKYKSTAKCMVDICSLFGFKNIKIFKYYLLRDRQMNLATEEYKYIEDENGNEDLDAEYELKFLKLPLDEDLDDYVRKGGNYVDYDEITYSDPKWDGGLDHDSVMKETLKEEFNFTRTKYISVDTMYDIAKMSAQQTYFFNFLYDNVYLESLLTIQVPFIEPGREFNVADLFTLLTVLTYYYRGVKDTIMDTQSKVLYVNGFNFKADLALLAEQIGPKKLNNTVVDPGSTLHAQEQLKKFRIPTTSIASLGEMMDIYINNMEVMDELIKGMREADNKKVYDVYKMLYDALCTVELTFDYYKNPETGDFWRDSEGDATYTEFLKHKDSSLYYIVTLVQEFEDESSRNQYIANVIDSITYALEEYIDSDILHNILNQLPVVGAEAVKGYIALIINFYKSYKVDFLGLNTIYTFDDKDENGIMIIDGVDLNRFWIKTEILRIADAFYEWNVNITPKDKLDIIDRIYMEIFTWANIDVDDYLCIKDKIKSLVNFVLHSIVMLEEEIVGKKSSYRLEDTYTPVEYVTTNTKFTPMDRAGIKEERIWIYYDSDTDPDNEYMNRVNPQDYDRIILADSEGDAIPGPKITRKGLDALSFNAITEILAKYYIDSNAASKDLITSILNLENPSDDKLPSETAFLLALGIKDTI